MKIKSIRMIYDVPRFFGGTLQDDDITYTVTADKLKKCFAYIRAHAGDSAMWVDLGDHSYGVWFENVDDAKKALATVKYSANYELREDTFKENFSDIKKHIYSWLKK